MLIDVVQIIVSLTIHAICIVKAEAKKISEPVKKLADLLVREIVQEIQTRNKNADGVNTVAGGKK